MAIYKRGGVYWYSFRFNGERHQASTKLGNAAEARKIEAKAKTDLALAIHGLRPNKPGPTLEKFKEDFLEFVRTRNGDHPATVEFYEEKVRRLLEHKPLAQCRLNLIDEAVVEEYIRHRKHTMSIASINREVTVLKRMLNVARKTFKLPAAAPTNPRLTGEKGREFVLSYGQEAAYLAMAEHTLRDFATLSLDTGVRAGEGVALEWTDVHIEGAHNSRSGYIEIRAGKTDYARRILSITPRVKAMLENRRRFLPDAVYVFQSPYWKAAKAAEQVNAERPHRPASQPLVKSKTSCCRLTARQCGENQMRSRPAFSRPVPLPCEPYPPLAFHSTQSQPGRSCSPS
jgi:integrase